MEEHNQFYSNYTMALFFSPDDRSYTYEHFNTWLLEQKLRLMDEGYIHFIILTPKHHLPDCWFVQAMKKPEGILFEVSKNEEGKNRVYAHSPTSPEELRRYLRELLEEDRVPEVSDWEYVGEFRSPDEDQQNNQK